MDGRLTERLVERLRGAGCVAAEDEASELLEVAGGNDVRLEELVAARCSGTPLAWLTGGVDFCGLRISVDPGVYVPRWQSQWVASAASRALGHSPMPVAVELCCGSGAVAAVLLRDHPGLHLIAVDLDPGAVRCARRNNVDAVVGDLYDPVDPAVAGTVDVIVAVAPYVPTALSTGAAPGWTPTAEPPLAVDGGVTGLAVVARIVAGAPDWLRTDGVLVLELASPQTSPVDELLAAAGFAPVERIADGDGEVCGVVARLREPRPST